MSRQEKPIAYQLPARRTAALLLGVVLVLAPWLGACFGGSPTPAASLPTPAPPLTTVADTASPAASSAQPTADTSLPTTPAPTASPALALASPGKVLDSYHMTALYVITSTLPGGVQRVDRTAVEGVWQRTNGRFGFNAQLEVDNSSGDRRQQLGLVVMDDAAAVRTDGQWSTIVRDSTIPYADPDNVLSLPFVTRVNRGENLGREQVANIAATHYRLTDPALFATVMQDALTAGSGIVKRVMLEGWVADAGYVVKYALEAAIEGAETLDDQGNQVKADQVISASYALDEINVAQTIQWPTDASPPGTVAVPGFAPNTFPVPDNAQVLPKLGVLEILTANPQQQVTDFYRSRLGDLGWKLEGEFGFFTAAKGDQKLNLTILPDDAAKLTVVRVFAQAPPEANSQPKP